MFVLLLLLLILLFLDLLQLLFEELILFLLELLLFLSLGHIKMPTAWLHQLLILPPPHDHLLLMVLFLWCTHSGHLVLIVCSQLSYCLLTIFDLQFIHTPHRVMTHTSHRDSCLNQCKLLLVKSILSHPGCKSLCGVDCRDNIATYFVDHS
jgi:hypothetical protein